MSKPRKASYLLFGLLGAVAVFFHLGPVLLAALFTYMILDLTQKPLGRVMPPLLSRWASLLIYLITAAGLAWMFAFFVKLSLDRTPAILGSLVPQIDSLAARHGIELPFENLQELRAVILDAIKENARSVTQASGLLTRGFFEILIGIFVSILFFFSPPSEDYGDNLFDALRLEFKGRSALFLESFERILGAQVLIALVNTVFTSLFLWATDMPYFPLLVLSTFIFGIIPIIGNIISNTIIVSVGLTVSFQLALLALAFLVAIHKTEYFLNSRIIGSRTNMPMWQILLGLLIGELALGIPGMILAPAVLHYAREELKAVRVRRGQAAQNSETTS